MPSKKTKHKLRNLLAKLSPQDEAKLLSANLADDIKEIASKIPKDTSSGILQLRESLADLQYNLIKKLETLSTKESLTEIKKNYLDNLKELTQKLNDLSSTTKTQIKNLSSDSLEKDKKNAEELDNLKEDIKKLKKDAMSVLSRGGSMNRKITVAGTDVLTRYTDINFTYGTVTNDDTNKRVDITFPGTGDVTGPASSTDNSLAIFDGTTGKILKNSIASENYSLEGGLALNSPTSPTANTLSIGGGIALLPASGGAQFLAQALGSTSVNPFGYSFFADPTTDGVSLDINGENATFSLNVEDIYSAGPFFHIDENQSWWVSPYGSTPNISGDIEADFSMYCDMVRHTFRMVAGGWKLFFGDTTGQGNYTCFTVNDANGKFEFDGGGIADFDAYIATRTNNTYDIGATDKRFKKGWFTDLECSNLPTIGGSTLVSALSSSLVPYTGATANVDLGVYSLSLGSVVNVLMHDYNYGVRFTSSVNSINSHAVEDWTTVSSDVVGGGYASFDAKFTADDSSVNAIDHLACFQARSTYASHFNMVDYLEGITIAMGHTGAGVIPRYTGIHIRDITGAGVNTQNLGLYIDDITNGITNYSIYTGLGTVSFGGLTETRNGLTTTGAIKTTGYPAATTWDIGERYYPFENLFLNAGLWAGSVGTIENAHLYIYENATPHFFFGASGNFYPYSNNAENLGSASYQFKDFFLAGSMGATDSRSTKIWTTDLDLLSGSGTITNIVTNRAATPGVVTGMSMGSTLYGTMLGFGVELVDVTANIYANGVPLCFSTTANETMRITTADKVGIGTKTPSEKLDVVGNVNFNAYKAIAMVCDNGATLPTSPTPVAGQWFLHTPTGRKILYQHNGTSWVPIMSIDTMTVYVDKTDGTDSQAKGTGIDTDAYKTIQYAIDQIPPINAGNVVINLSAETYTEALIVRGKSYTGNYTITIQGAELNTTTPVLSATGDSWVRGTAPSTTTPPTPAVLTDTGAFTSFGTNGLRGKFIEFNASGVYYVIGANDNDTLTYADNVASTLTPLAYKIFDPTTTLANTTAVVSLTVGALQIGVNFKYMNFTSTANVNHILTGVAAQLTCTYCNVKGSPNTASININVLSRVAFLNCYMWTVSPGICILATQNYSYLTASGVMSIETSNVNTYAIRLVGGAFAAGALLCIYGQGQTRGVLGLGGAYTMYNQYWNNFITALDLDDGTQLTYQYDAFANFVSCTTEIAKAHLIRGATFETQANGRVVKNTYGHDASGDYNYETLVVAKRFGDKTTNYTEIGTTGNQTFVGSAQFQCLSIDDQPVFLDDDLVFL